MAQYVVLPQQMKRWETEWIERGVESLVLMENAAANMARYIMEHEQPGKAVVFCGNGNNGGDGMAIARHLLLKGFRPVIVLVGERERMTADALKNCRMAELLGIPIVDAFQAEEALSDAAFAVDALFGTGLTREVTGRYAQVIGQINTSGKRVYAVDIPSGIGDRGEVMGCAVKADATVTFQFLKVGHLLYPGREYSGSVCVADIGIPTKETALFRMEQLQPEDIQCYLPKRDADTNKGNYGRVALIAGSERMLGAAALCAKAALRSGCGLLTLGTVQSQVPAAHTMLDEAMCVALPEKDGMLSAGCAAEVEALIAGKTAVVVGPGLGMAEGTAEALSCCIGKQKLVIDADGLNALAKDMTLLCRANADTVLTPHPGEMARLCGTDIEQIRRDPLSAACDMAKQYGVTVLLKGSTSVIAAPDGRVTFNPYGNPGMAKGGSGDVLSGIIAAFLAQGLCGYDAARLGSMVLGLAGDAAAYRHGEYAVLATDIIEQIGGVLQSSAAL